MNLGERLNFRAMAAIATLMLLAGCGSTVNNLTMISTDQRHDFKQTFSQAYSALNDNGDYDIVLVHDANADATSDASDVVTPSTLSPRQLVHIRVFWIPDHGVKLDHPAATNASIRWYVFGDRPQEGSNVLEYSGSALVLVSDDGKTAAITIRGANLKVAVRRGQMADPLGPSSVAGTITARVDRRGVEEVLAEVKAADLSLPQQTSSAQ